MSKSSDNTDSNVTREVEVAVIGAGTAGQNAFRQASKTIKNIGNYLFTYFASYHVSYIVVMYMVNSEVSYLTISLFTL